MIEHLKAWLEAIQRLHPGARLTRVVTPPAFQGQFLVVLWVQVPGRSGIRRFGAQFEEFADRDEFVQAAETLLAKEESS